MGIGENSEGQRLLTITIGDTNEHDFPDTDGDDESTAQDPIDHRKYGAALVKITNDLTVAISGRLEGTTTSDSWDPNGTTFADPVTLGSFSGLGAGESTYLAVPPREPFPALRAVVSADSSPSGGNSVTAEWEKKHGGD